MSASFGIFDVFANAIPGSLYVTIAVYLSDRFGWFDAGNLGDLDSALLALIVVTASYLAGHIFAGPSRFILDRVPRWRRSHDDIRQEFKARNPSLAREPFIEADVYTLLAGLRLPPRSWPRASIGFAPWRSCSAARVAPSSLA
jgi:hypothetical protein